jgi:hypothetical protein
MPISVEPKTDDRMGRAGDVRTADAEWLMANTAVLIERSLFAGHRSKYPAAGLVHFETRRLPVG